MTECITENTHVITTKNDQDIIALREFSPIAKRHDLGGDVPGHLSWFGGWGQGLLVPSEGSGGLFVRGGRFGTWVGQVAPALAKGGQIFHYCFLVYSNQFLDFCPVFF